MSHPTGTSVRDSWLENSQHNHTSCHKECFTSTRTWMCNNFISLNMVLQVSILFLLMSGLSCISSDVDEPSSNSETNIDISDVDNEFASDTETNIKSSLYVGDPQHEIKLDKYFNLTELDELMGDLCKEYPTLVRVRSLGLSEEHNTSVRGVEISHDVQEERKLLKPMVQLVTNYHPDDAVAYAMMISLIQYLVRSDGYDDGITRMLNTTDIWIIPTFNLDSLKRSAQTSYYISTVKKTRQNKLWNSQEFIEDHPFVISANIQGAAATKLKKNRKNYYEQENPTHLLMQKNNYYYQNSFKYRVRIICSKNVTASELPKYWDATLESMLKLIESVHRGVYGLVKDIEGKTIQRAIIRVKGFQSIRVTQAGEYWLLLPLGKSYNITASAWGHIEETKEVAVTNEEPYVQVDFVLNFRRIHGTVRDKEGNLIQNFFILGCSISRPFTGGLYSSLFDFEDDAGEHCEITASARGYIEETKSVHLTKDELNVSIDFVLDKARVYGVVKDINSNPVLEAVIKKVEYKICFNVFGKMEKIKWGEKSTGVNGQGEYSMPLEKLQKTYDLIVSAPGYKTKTTSVFATREDPHIQLDFKLRKPFFKCSGN